MRRRTFAVLLAVLVVPACQKPGTESGKAVAEGENPSGDANRLIVTERDVIPSRLPWKYADLLDPANPDCILAKDDVRPEGFMPWAFYGGTLDPDRLTLDSTVFFFVMNPDHLRPMMRGLENLDPELIREMKKDRCNCLLGAESLALRNMSVGDQFTLSGLNLKGINLDFQIVGLLPDGRYNKSAFMNASHLRAAFDEYERANGRKHPQAERSLSMIWLETTSPDAAKRVAKLIEGSARLTDPPVKCETAEEAIAKAAQGSATP